MNPRAPQPHLFPDGLFDPDSPGDPRPWTCARAIPRWEKKLARWLAGRGWEHYLPVVPRTTFSGRKRRTTWVPLLPGYVFVAGDREKKDFAAADAVAYVLKPRSARDAAELHRQIWGVWKALESGSPLEVAGELERGDAVRVVAGPLRGVEGCFVKWGKGGRLILQVDLIREAIVMEIAEDLVMRVPA